MKADKRDGQGQSKLEKHYVNCLIQIKFKRDGKLHAVKPNFIDSDQGSH